MPIANIFNSYDTDVHEEVTRLPMASAAVEALEWNLESDSGGQVIEAEDSSVSINEADVATRTVLRFSEMTTCSV